MSKSYYDKDDQFTQECLDLSNEVCELIEPIFKKEIKKGYSIRQICAVVQNAIFDQHLMFLLGRGDE